MLRNILQVEHGCAATTIGGVRGVIVVGGATGDDVVEFLDINAREEWRVLGKLNRGRGGRIEAIFLFLIIGISVALRSKKCARAVSQFDPGPDPFGRFFSLVHLK